VCSCRVKRYRIRKSLLLCSKSRVSPPKTFTVPKRELLGAELLASLMSDVADLKVYVGKYFCWCDSAVALSWIQEKPARLMLSSPIDFRRSRIVGYVPTSLNPADILSRFQWFDR